MVQKRENQSQKKKQWIQQIRKKAKIKGQKLSFRSVDINKLTKKAKMRARKAVDTLDKNYIINSLLVGWEGKNRE